MESADVTGLKDALTVHACAQFVASVLPVVPMEGLAVVLLDPHQETSRVVFSLGGSHPVGSSPGRRYDARPSWGKGDRPPMSIALQGREGELGAILYRGPTAGSYGPDEDALVRQSANLLAGRLENIHLRRRLDRMAEENLALDRIGKEVSLGGTAGRVVRRFAQEIRKVLAIDALSIYVADPRSGRLMPSWRFGAGARAGRHGPKTNRESSETCLVLPGLGRQSDAQQVLSLSAAEGWPNRQDGSRKPSVLTVPVLDAGSVIGAVVAESHQPGAYDTESNKLLQQAAALLAAPMAKGLPSHEGVGSALTNEIARTLAASRHLEDVLPSLASVLAKHLSFACVALAWIDPNGWRINTLRASPGMEHPIVKYGGEDWAAIHTQVLFQGQCIGMVDLWRKNDERFTSREQELLDFLGLQMGPYVQNARLSEMAQGQAYRLTQLQVIGGSPGPPKETDMVAQEAVAEAIVTATMAGDEKRKKGRKPPESLYGELLSDVAASLRQPLTSIKGYADSLAHTEVSWPEELRREFLETIRHQADRLDQAVSDLLVPVRWGSGAVMLDPVVFTVRGLLDRVAVELEKRPRGSTVQFRCDPALVPVLVDTQRMVQVILWLLQVADERLGPDMTFRVEGDWEDGRPRITVGVCVQDDSVDIKDLISVSDNHQAGSRPENWWDDWMDGDLKLVACRHILEGHGVILQITPSPDIRDLFCFTLPPAAE